MATSDRFERLVFDTEPLIAYFTDEDHGTESRAHEYLLAVYDGTSDASLSVVNAAEVHYVVARTRGERVADRTIETLTEMGFQFVGVADCWLQAARYKDEYAIALGDVFALAAADDLDATLVVGDDGDWDGPDR